jgi:DNA-binding MarR family transcriptional regulator
MCAMSTEVAARVPDSAQATASHAAADDPALGSWRAFIHAHAKLTRRLDEELQAAHGLSLAEYDALLQLARTPDRRLRMSMLADRVLLSRSGITRLVDRLVADGTVMRTACPTDARGAEAALTPIGLDRLRAASRTHLAGVQRYFLDAVGDVDGAAIERGLSRVVETVGGPATDSHCDPTGV